MTGPEMLALRKRMSLTQTQFGARLGYATAQIRNFETGNADIPVSVELACAALALGLTGYPKKDAL